MEALNHNLNFTKKESPMKGFQEVVFSVSNLERTLEFYQEICGWKLVHEGQGDQNLKQLWNLDDDASIKEAFLVNPGDKEGFLRLVQFKNVPQKQIRSGTQIWDSGGIFDVNLRTKDMSTMYPTFLNHGWNGYTDPNRFTFNQFDVSEVLLKGHDGVTIAMMERFHPPLEGFEFEKISRMFNSTTICSDYDTTKDFFLNKLGFKLNFETEGNKRSNGPNVVGIPPNINGDITVPVCIVSPDGKNVGSIELMEPKELKGKDCSELAKPPNLGILMLRFPVKDAASYAEEIEKRGVVLNTEVQTLDIAPYGKMKVFSVRTPDGVWLEFMELLNK